MASAGAIVALGCLRGERGANGDCRRFRPIPDDRALEEMPVAIGSALAAIEQSSVVSDSGSRPMNGGSSKNPYTDPDAAMEFVLGAMHPDIGTRIFQVRAVLKPDEQRSAFLVLAIVMEMLQRLEDVQNNISRPIESLREEVVNLESILKSYSVASNTQLKTEVANVGAAVTNSRLKFEAILANTETTLSSIAVSAASTIGSAESGAVSSIGEATAALSAAKDVLENASTAFQQAKNAMTRLDPAQESGVVQRLVDAVATEFNRRISYVGVGITFLAGALIGFVLDALWLHWVHK